MTDDPAVDEYKDLRAELLQSQQTRTLVLAFTFTALGVLAGVALAKDNRDDTTLVTAALTFAALLICASLYLTTVLTQRIDRLSEYIRKRLESRLGFGWESDWATYRAVLGEAQVRPLAKLVKPKLPLGTSKPLAGFYLVLVGTDLTAFFIASDEPGLGAVLAVCVPGAAAIYLALNLYFRFGWQLGWTSLYEKHPRRVWPWSSDRSDTSISLDFSTPPSDVALVLGRQRLTRQLADDLARALSLDAADRELLHQEIVAAVAEVVDRFNRPDHGESPADDR
jgi:hypothetical protein